jgi:diguanylate cyclase (GGDEF)-like protein
VEGGIGSAEENSMRLRSKILALMVVPGVLVAATLAISIRAGRATTESQFLVDHTNQVKGTLNAVLADLVDAETGMRGYVLTGNGDFLGPYEQGTANVGTDLDRLSFLIRDNPIQQERLDALRLLAPERLRILVLLRPYVPITVVRNPRRIQPILAEGQIVMDEIRNLVGTMTGEENRLLGIRQASLARAHRAAFLVQVVALPIAVLVGMVSVFVFARRVVVRLGAIERNAVRLEDGVPLDKPEDGQDEIGHLSRLVFESAERIAALRDDLRRSAGMDTLTNLHNRRGFMPIAEHALRIAQRTQEPVALVFLDVDGLKHVNDTKGHLVGDTLIAEAAMVIRTTFRASDLPARMGGDEFCVLLRGESAIDAERAVQRLQEAVAGINAEPDRVFELSLSAGIAMYDPAQPISLDQLVEHADGSMYAHKRAKRGLAPAK